MKKSCILIILLLLDSFVFAQETLIKGRVSDAITNESIPFVNITFKGSVGGVTTDFDGFFTLRSLKPVDSIKASFLGYKSRTKAIQRGKVQTIDFQLMPDAKSLGTVDIIAGENPAHPIMRKAIENKIKYSMRSLQSYEYESYHKILVDVDNISERFRNRKLFDPVTALFDSLKAHAGEDGEAHLPVFYSENLSDVYYLRDPERKRELVKGAKISAVGLQDGGLTSQLTGSTFEDYNFNENKVLFFSKEFTSPLADNGFLVYKYYLMDSIYIEGRKCYQIKVKPRNDQDLAFSGNVWIADSSYALVQANLDISNSVNLNLIEKVQIQQELQETTAGPWIPYKTRVVIDFSDLNNNLVGLIAKFYLSSKKIVVNQPRPLSFYEYSLEVSEDALLQNNEFWKENRHEKLSASDINMYNMIDTVKNLPRVKTFVDIFYILVNGYKTVGKIDYGPYINLYSNNQIEGHKFRLGFRTNVHFSKKWIHQGYLAYGTRDGKFKYNIQTERIFSRRKWTVVGLQHRVDIDQVGVDYNYSRSAAFAPPQSMLFISASQISNSAFLNGKVENRTWIESGLTKGVTQRVTLQNTRYHHYFRIAGTEGNGFQQDFTTSEIVLDTRFAYNEYFVQYQNKRLRLGGVKTPIVNLRFTQGIKGVIGSEFNYTKLNLTITQKIRMGILGYSKYAISTGKVFSHVPYTLLEVHRGNETPFYSKGAYNLMNYLEFVSDKYVSFNYNHHFDGLFFNRVPLLRKLYMREVIFLDAVYGGLSSKNSSYGTVNAFNTLVKKPYVEAGFGIENILVIFKLNFIYRLTYTDAAYKQLYEQSHPGNSISKFGFKLSLDFAF